MKLVTYRSTGKKGELRLGAMVEDGIVDLQRAEEALIHIEELKGPPRLPSSMIDLLRLGDRGQARVRRVLARGQATGFTAWRSVFRRLADTHLAAPVPRPGKIIAVGLNYREHTDEQNVKVPELPVVFAKFPSSVCGPRDSIRYPVLTRALDYEVELGIVIGRMCRRVSVEQARESIAGYTIINDVTARDLQKSDRQWLRAKSLDTFCPMGPALVTADQIAFPPRLSICTWVNREVRQHSNTSNMILGVAELVSFLSQAFTLEPGDCIATGTPAGVGAFRQPPVFLQPGDVVEMAIEGIGRLHNVIEADPA